MISIRATLGLLLISLAVYVSAKPNPLAQRKRVAQDNTVVVNSVDDYWLVELSSFLDLYKL